MLTEKIRIKLKSFNNQLIVESTNRIIQSVANVNCKLIGPISLPMDKRIYCLLRSPHVDKKSREQFGLATHKRLIDLVEPTAKTVEALRKLNLPAGVDVEIKQ